MKKWIAWILVCMLICGTALAGTWVCPNCGTENITTNFCGNCGTRNPGTESTLIPEPRGKSNLLMADEEIDYFSDKPAEDYLVLGSGVSRRSITRIDFESTLDDMPSDAWDVSAERDGSVMAWVANSSELHIAANGTIYANEDCGWLFGEYANTTEINFNGCFDTSKTTNMTGMFCNCSALTALDVSGFNTENVTNMRSMFSNCTSLTVLNVSGFNTENVKNMKSMFAGCSALTALDVSGFRIGEDTETWSMFYNCGKLGLSEEDVGKPSGNKSGKADPSAQAPRGTSNLLMADRNENLVLGSKIRRDSITRIDFESTLDDMPNDAWDVSAEKDNSVMAWITNGSELHIAANGTICANENCTWLFYEYTNAAEINFNGCFDTGNVTSMKGMFYDCSSLASLDLSGFNTEKVTDMSGMFSYCSSLTAVDVSRFNTGNVTDMALMFNYCSSLTSLDVSGFNTENVTGMSWMFRECSSLTSLDVSGFNTEKVTNMRDMFDGCDQLGLTSDDIGKPSGNKSGKADSSAQAPRGTSNLLMADRNENLVLGSEIRRDSITRIDFESTLDDMPNDAWDVSAEKDNSVMAWVANDSELHIAADGRIYANENCSCLFSYYTNVTEINFNGCFDTSNVTDMYGMFNRCSSLTSLDLIGFNTEQVTDMVRMFENCSSLTALDVSGFNTEKVEIMSEMFSGCSSLASLDVSGFNTEKVTDMGWMFNDCSSLTSLDVSGFNTENVTDMENMFDDCSSLTSLDVSGFNTEKVTDMESMFYGCSALTSLDVSGFNTEKVTDMGWMFSDCSSLTSLDVSGFNTEQVTNMMAMFYNCSSLTALDVSGFSTEQVMYKLDMFTRCNKLGLSWDDVGKPSGNKSVNRNILMADEIEYNVFRKDYPVLGSEIRRDSITRIDFESTLGNMPNDAWDVSAERDGSVMAWITNGSELHIAADGTICANENCSWLFSYYTNATEINFNGCLDTGNTKYMKSMFSGCHALTALDVSGFKTEKVTDMACMFAGCSALTALDVSGFKTEKVTEMWRMFNDCSSLTSLDVSGFNTENVTDMESMFYGCSALTSLDVSGFNTEKVAYMSYMFSMCRSLTSLDVSGFNTEKVRNMLGMFYGCSSLTSLDVSGFNTENVMDMMYMFNGCDKLGLTSADVGKPSGNKFVNRNILMVDEIEYNVFRKDYPVLGSEIRRDSITRIDFESTLGNMPNDAWDVSAERDGSVMAWVANDSELHIAANGRICANENCSSLFSYYTNATEINFNGRFDTGNTKYMKSMFSGCHALTALDVSGFKTEKVTDMACMFTGCSALTALDVSGFKTEKVTEMWRMFNDCSSLTALDVSGFNTKLVQSMREMFSNCSSLTFLDVSGFNTEKVTNMSWMFHDCSSLTALDVSGFNTEKVMDMSYMFKGCDKLGLTSDDVGKSSGNMAGTMIRGSKGNNVKELQNLLIQKDFLLSGSADGNFGPKTENAVKNAQAYFGLPQSGRAGYTLVEKLKK